MKVSVSGIDNSIISHGAKKLATDTKATSFGGSTKIGVETMKAIQQDLHWIPKSLLWIEKHQGEISNSIITALGTAIVAPIFIAFNPFSKEDKETKAYSAWRQPISAILALAAQIGINIKFNHMMEKAASTGQLAFANLKANPEKSYLKRLVKLKHPEYDKKQTEASIEYYRQKALKKEVARAREELKDAKITNEMLVGRKSFAKARDELTVTYKDKLSKMSRKEAAEFINKKAIEQASTEIMKDLRANAAKKLFIRNTAKGKKSVDQVIKLVTGNLAKSKTESEKIMLKEVLEQLSVIKAYEAKNNLKPFSSLKNLGTTFEEILHNVKIKQVVLASAENAAFSLKQWKLWLGIGISLLTLPFSCGLLNWSYPRIMEYIMPNASKKKQQQQQQNMQQAGKGAKV